MASGAAYLRATRLVRSGAAPAVTWARPGRRGIVTDVAEPPRTGCRHNGMLNTRSLTRRHTRTGRTRHGAIADLMIGSVLLGGGMFLAGCSAASSSSASSSGAATSQSGPASQAVAAPAATAAPAGNGAARSAAGGQADTGTTVRLAPASSIIYTAQLTVRASNVTTAATQAAQIAEGVGGYVSDETASSDPDHPSQATASVQLKIPAAAYPVTLGQLASRLGTQLSLQQQAQDVTQQVADVNSQVTSDEAAITQLRALLSHAGTVGDLLNVQNQINGEEASLESMQAQQRALSHETSYATVTLTLLGPKAKPPVHHPKAPPTLAGGFGAGWHALRVTVSWILAFVGATAPFAVILAIAGYVIYRSRRWLIRRRPAEPAAPES
jgi:Domain of unknown function (DUF4349)